MAKKILVTGGAHGIGSLHQTEVSLVPRVIETALGKYKSIKIYGTDYSTAQLYRD